MNQEAIQAALRADRHERRSEAQRRSRRRAILWIALFLTSPIWVTALWLLRQFVLGSIG